MLILWCLIHVFNWIQLLLRYYFFNTIFQVFSTIFLIFTHIATSFIFQVIFLAMACTVLFSLIFLRACFWLNFGFFIEIFHPWFNWIFYQTLPPFLLSRLPMLFYPLGKLRWTRFFLLKIWNLAFILDLCNLTLNRDSRNFMRWSDVGIFCGLSFLRFLFLETAVLCIISDTAALVFLLLNNRRYFLDIFQKIIIFARHIQTMLALSTLSFTFIEPEFHYGFLKVFNFIISIVNNEFNSYGVFIDSSFEPRRWGIVIKAFRKPHCQ